MSTILGLQQLKGRVHAFVMRRIEHAIKNGRVSGCRRWGKCVEQLEHTHFQQWMKDYSEKASAECIIELFYFADQPTQKKVFEFVAMCRREHYFRAWAQHLTREEFVASLLRWRHMDVVRDIVQRYDPTFLTWIGLRFNCPELYERYYPLSDHDQVWAMLEGRMFEESEVAHWNLDYYKNQRNQNFEILLHLQRLKFQAMFADQGEYKRSKM